MLHAPRHDPAAPPTLATALKAGTRELHRAAERAGIMRGLLHAQVGRNGYCLLLRNLHALYQSLEHHLERHAAHPVVSRIAWAGFRRGDALTSDLDVLHGPRWRDELALGVVMQRYVARLDVIAQSEPSLLVAHAYVRYLGDLSGGQLLRPVVASALGLDSEKGLAFYRFDDDAKALAARLRTGLDALAPAADGIARLVDEACWSFSRHIDLFEELAAADSSAEAAPVR